MYSNKEKLKQLASERFVDDLATAMIDQIEEAAHRQADNSFLGTDRGGIVPYSAWTLFLADSFYSELGTGEFTGRLVVSWNGMDSFIFIPDQNKPLAYRTAAGRVIKPRLMETDGGSIPRILRGLEKFSSWGYAPAFIIHDWLFAAQKCGHEPDTDWTFAESALIMAEAMKTLMEVGFYDYEGNIFKLQKAEDTLYLMYQAVSSFIAKNVWEDNTNVHCMD